MNFMPSHHRSSLVNGVRVVMAFFMLLGVRQIEAAPIIQNNPTSQILIRGASTQLSVTATGNGSLSYQWQKDGVDIPGATSNSFSLSSAQPWHIGNYTVKVSDSAGAVTSDVATLNLNGVNSGIWKGLIGYWQFDGNLEDSSYFSRHMTGLQNSFVGDRFQYQNAAVQVQNGAYLTLSPTPTDINRPFTLSFWTKGLPSGADKGQTLFSSGHDRGNGLNCVFVPLPNSGGLLQFATAWGQVVEDSGFRVKFINKWAQVTLIRKEGTFELWVNGTLIASNNALNQTYDQGFLEIGRHSFSPAYYNSDVNIDSMRFYNRSLSATEVQALFASEASISPLLPTPTSAQISATGATLGGSVTSEGQSAITERGVVYSATATNADPLIGGTGVTKLTATGTTGVFTVPVTGLAQGTSYSFKAYATNSQGTSYTSVSTFTTGAGEQVWTGLPRPQRPTNFPLPLPSRNQVQGKIQVWAGGDTLGETTVPSSASDFVDVVAGQSHGLALRANGTVLGWGWNSAGQTQPPANLSDVAAVDATYDASLALKTDGTIRVWGTQGVGGAGDVPAGLPEVHAIACGPYHGLALLRDGTVRTWGLNNYGQSTPPAGLSNVVQVAGGYLHSAALKADGTVVVWGAGFYGQTAVPTGLTDVVMIDAGIHHMLALRGDGTVVAWGSNGSGQITVPPTLSNVVAVAAGYYRSEALRADGSVVQFGEAWPNAPSKLLKISSGGSLTVGLQTPSTIADLSALTLSRGTLSPAFASVTTAYTAGVSGATTSITVTATLAQAGATIEARVNGGIYALVTNGSASEALALDVGMNTVDIRVTGQDRVTQKIYSVTVTRANPIQNLVVAQRSGTRLIDLTYDLDAAAPVKITVEISSDGGQTYFVPAHTMTGDVGLNVASGIGKTMTWDAGADWAGNRSDQMRFRIVADDLSDGFSYIPEGPFTMGRTSGDTDTDAPPTLVKVSRFELQTTETSKAQWDVVRAWAVNNGYTDLAIGAGKAANHPVQMINWWNVVKWCNARSEKEGLTPVYSKRHSNDHGIELGEGRVGQQGCPTLWTTNLRF